MEDTFSIRYSEIPNYLQQSAFYLALNDEDALEVIQIPRKCYSHNDNVNGEEDFAQLLRVIDFWGVTRLPDGFIKYCCERNPSLWKGHYDGSYPTNLVEELYLIFLFGPKEFLQRAIPSARKEIVEYLILNGPKDETSCAVAAEFGRLDYLKLLHEHGYEWNNYTAQKAAEGGHLSCLKYLHENGCSWDGHVYTSAASGNHMHCFQYAYECGLPWRYARKRGISWGTDICASLAQTRLCFLQFAVERGCPLDSQAVTEAVKKNNAECLQYLLEASCPIPKDACLLACEMGHLECLQLLHLHGAFWDANTAHAAAKNNQLTCFQFLCQNSCPKHDNIALHAVQKGHFNLLRCALENGCTYSDHLLLEAAASEKNSFTSLTYLIGEQGLSMPPNGELFIAAFVRGDFECVQYLMDQGCVFNDNSGQCSTLWLQGLREHVKYTHYYSQLMQKFDPSLLECIKYAVDHCWDICSHGVILLSHLQQYQDKYPLCYAFLLSEGYLHVRNVLLPDAVY